MTIPHAPVVGTLLKAPDEGSLSLFVRDQLQEHIDYKFKELKGKLLTVMDASFHDPVQRKAMKDIVSQNLQLSQHDLMVGYDYLSADVADIVGDDWYQMNPSGPKSALAPVNHGLKYVYSRVDNQPIATGSSIK